MKLFLSLLAVSVAFNSASLANNANQGPHLDLEATSNEYDLYLNSLPHGGNKAAPADEPSIAKALAIGHRLSAWIQFENSKRPADQQIKLTSSGTRYGIPIETPSVYNPNIIQTKLDTAMAALPADMATTLTGTDNFPDHLPVADEIFITLGRAVDKVYQSAARWKSLKPYMSEYINAKSEDVRGYYFLNKNGWDAKKLSTYSTLDASTQADLKTWLIQICINTVNQLSICQTEFTNALSKGTIAGFYTKYIGASKANWDHFFLIPGDAKRSDITWTSSNPNVMTVPFNTPTVARIQSYLSDNIQDEWKFNGWNLKLNFGSFANGPLIEFQTGVVPHVESVGGNVIVMDQNQSVEEYESQWTIRHEFGHVLGFLDCYVEFYDESLNAFVNYQLDTTDLMCSRAGNMKERLYTELKRAYFTP